ncbi:hypothetical protein KOR42_14310 [Thalassoglobus neptunius]|uniref:Uncharacterized protein n=1 Tax=Thalassoglobus neptunius TaxID=1938619 RepID=A0A5C5X6U0_9PLAN|nr:hypothetical protein [Thalassoglobus neptunius]TWT58061.1 hypothetical protein KOR42_14310 [Thalassoglobus neptunius]
MAVYRWINRQPNRVFWRSFLRFGKREKPGDQRGKLRAAAHIADRPSVVDTKQHYGDWEGDTVLGARRRSALVTLNERKSGFALVGLIRRFKAQTYRDKCSDSSTPFHNRSGER